jgi:hypothetical protein
LTAVESTPFVVLFSIAPRWPFVRGWRQAFTVRTELVPFSLRLTKEQGDGEDATAKRADAEFRQRYYSMT